MCTSQTLGRLPSGSMKSTVSTRRPFHQKEKRLMQSSFELWGNKTVATEIMSFVASTAYRMLDSDSAKYYVRTQFGDDESILDQMTANLQNLSFV
ncbi:hypothetical protein J008_06724 [Cryptococcus neoformans]|nr:hypothetical protein J008_06724 [Cryptococcus neoformans var. grubii]